MRGASPARPGRDPGLRPAGVPSRSRPRIRSGAGPIRRALRGDAEACASILNAWIDATDWMPRCHSRAEVEAYYADFVLVRRTVWVAGDPVAGFLAIDADEGRVTALYVAAPGQGTGRALLDRAKAHHDRLDLRAFVANAGARRFYEREGFEEVGRTAGDNEEGLPDVIYRWERRT